MLHNAQHKVIHKKHVVCIRINISETICTINPKQVHRFNQSSWLYHGKTIVNTHMEYSCICGGRGIVGNHTCGPQ